MFKLTAEKKTAAA